MKVMIVGYIDAVGQSIALRLYKEGHDVYWLTESTNEEYTGEKNQCKFYRQDMETNHIKNIFLANSIDVVIFLATSFVDKKTHHEKEKSYIIPKLTNILVNAEIAGVGAFLLATNYSKFTSAINETDVLLKSCEDLCRVYKERASMNVGVVRIPMIYGGTKISQLGSFGNLLDSLKEDVIQLPFNEESLLHVLNSNDIADAFYRIICEEAYEDWTLGMLEPYSVQKFTSILESIAERPLHFEYDKKEAVAISMSEIIKFKNRFSWATFHSLENDIDQIKPLLLPVEDDAVTKKAQIKINIPTWMKNTTENILLFLIVVLVHNLIANQIEFNYIDIRLIYVVMIAAFYGKTQSFVAMLLASLHHSWSIWSNGIDISYLYYSVESWTPFAMYILGGASIGYLFDKKKDENESVKNELRVLEKKYYFLKDVYKDVCDVKAQLQKQIIVSKDSFGRVYEITRELDTLQPELIFFKTVSIIENVMGVDCVSIYTINNNQLNYARLIAHSTKLSGKLSASLKFDDYPEMKKKMLERKLYINKDLYSDYPAYVAPIVDGDSFIAMVVVQDVDFNRFTLYYQNLFQIVCGLVQNNVIKAYKYSQKGLESAYIDNTIIYKSKEYRNQIHVLKDAKENVNVSFIQCKATDLLGMSLEEFSTKVQKLLRSTDFIGMDDDMNYYIVFMQTDVNNIGILYNRFKSHDIELEVVE